MSKKSKSEFSSDGSVATGVCTIEGCGGKTSYKPVAESDKAGTTLDYVVSCQKCKKWWESGFLPEQSIKLASE